ncbi:MULTISPECIES: HEPN domain-containing protein [unclassified Coleofasciculus]|uniref:HEPN domain-containing protein n=1 Tax=unclassified Coleofasciculus TaxID=2692782 RepID=UPI0018811656|nr:MULTISPECIES: HEPN domain-containing protein [unclassified Coleofasciculus]MBE9129760.1 hypothetical protein [Coleofasciculus sp. LEGE 07081]MBE9152240.1 hypothetical protein [Coleofasciculus sp. LEGE 07092]
MKTLSYKKKWEELYKFRCQIAHNSQITKDDYDKIKTLVNELKTKLQVAIDRLDQIEVSDEEKETIAENVSVNDEIRKVRVANTLRTIKAEALKAAVRIDPTVSLALAVLEGWQSVSKNPDSSGK